MHKISILMNCLNGARYLKRAIDSIYAQTYPDWEIIFLDNASTDDSAEIAKSYDSRLKYYTTGQTIPLYAARNAALEHVTGQFIAFLDVDDFWEPEKLATQLAIMNKYPMVYLICSGYFRFVEQLNTTSRHSAYRSRFINFLFTLRHYPVSLSTVMLRYTPQSAQEIRFEPTLNLTGDYELFLKLIHQHQAYYISTPLVTFHVTSNNLSAKLFRDWPRELEKTHERLAAILPLSKSEKNLMNKRYVKTCSLVYLANHEWIKTRQVIKKYMFTDAKLFLIYLSTFNQRLAQWIIKVRGFS